MEYIDILLAYVVVANAVAFAAFGWDKYKARTGRWRTPESTLLLLAAVGGSVGALLGMFVFRHKTRHLKFLIGLPAILIVQIVLAVCVVARLSQVPMPI